MTTIHVGSGVGRTMTINDYIHQDGLGDPIDWRHLALEAPMDQISSYLMTFDSYKRTGAMAMLMRVTATYRPEYCVRIFLEWASCCDAPWGCRLTIADALRCARTEVNLPDLLGPDEREFYTALPDLVSIWRGCEKGRERGLSWTFDKTVAEGFAQGKRCINKNPTLAHAQIPKPHIFGVFLDRREHEIAVDPRRLRKLERQVCAHTHVDD